MSKLDFSNLHCHSDSSVLDGAARPEEMAERVAKLGQPYLALTDHGTFGGTADLYRACKKAGVKFIAGQEFYIVPDTQAVGFGPRENLRDGRNFHLTMLAKNEQGYRDLVALSSLAHLRENFFNNPRIDHAMLRQIDTGNIVCLSGCVGGELAQSFLEIIKPIAAKQVPTFNKRTGKTWNKWEWRFPKHADKEHPLVQQAVEAARDTIKMYRSLFPEDQYIYEIMYHGLAMEAWVIKYVLPEARRYGLKWVVTNDAHHAKPSDKLIADLLWSIQTRSDFCGSNDPKILDLCSGDKIHSRLEDVVHEKYLKQGIEYSIDIGEMCKDFKLTPLESKTHNIPEARDTEGNIFEKPYREMMRRGKGKLERLCERYPDQADDYRARYKREGKTIKLFGYQNYFLATHVFVKWAKEQGILVGAGRGSGAGSLVAYCLEITEIDPILHKLRFERFLNPAKQSLPDFDIDFQSDRFEEVIEKLAEIYGDENVRRVSTYSRFAPRGIMTNLLEILPTGMSFQEIKAITKELPADITEAEADLDFMGVWWRDLENPKLRAIAEQLKKVHGYDIEKISSQFYGLRKGIGTHAAGVVISDERLPLAEWIPNQLIASTGKTVTQFNMDALDMLGFVKFDILSLATLTLLADVYEMIGGNPFDEFELYEDAATYEMISNIETDAVFQLTGHAARQVVRQIGGCHEFEDIVSVMALGRPGAIKWAGRYRDNRGKKNLKLAHPMLNELLKASNGIILYQDDVLNIGYEIGMDDAEVDELLQAIKKKNYEKMAAVKPKFYAAARRSRWREAQTDNVWGQIKDYQGYGFNRPHAVSYADLSYKTAYLKANFPAEFIVAKLRQISTANREDRGPLVRYAKMRGIKVKPPHVNRSGVFTEVQNGAIRIGLSEVLDVGIPSAKTLIARRDKKKFEKEDFVDNATGPRGGKRDPYLSGIEGREEVHKIKVNKKARDALFAIGAFPGTKNKETRWGNEKEYLGCNISEHHNQETFQSIRRAVLAPANMKIVNKRKPDEGCRMGGVLVGVNVRLTKTGRNKGQPMAFLTVEIDEKEYEVVAFAEMYEVYRKKLKSGRLIYCKCDARYSKEYGKTLIAKEISIFR